MSKIDIEKLEQKLERCKNICIDEVDKNGKKIQSIILVNYVGKKFNLMLKRL